VQFLLLELLLRLRQPPPPPPHPKNKDPVILLDHWIGPGFTTILMGKYLIAGLGNIGPEYAGTRHNIGFDIVDELVQKHGGTYLSKRFAELSEIRWKGKDMFCIKPATYMNLSGKAVKYWMDKEKIPLDQVLVVVDEVALPQSRLRLRPSGSTSGHNGLLSIQEELGTDAYARLRFGIGNDFPKGMQIEYVLGKWTQIELPLIRLKIQKSVEIIECYVSSGIERAMNQYNKIEVTL
jgi:PTH1 family peptidyl-tRNA hydrolase